MGLIYPLSTIFKKDALKLKFAPKFGNEENFKLFDYKVFDDVRIFWSKKAKVKNFATIYPKIRFYSDCLISQNDLVYIFY